MVKSTTVLKLLFPYGTFAEAWSDKALAKKWLMKRIYKQEEDVQMMLVLQKVHLLQNGWSLKAFFEPVAEESMPMAIEALKTIVGASGRVELLTSEETAETLANDDLYKAQQMSLQKSVGNFDAAQDLINKIYSLHARNTSDDDAPSKRAKHMAEDLASVVATSHRVAASGLKVAQDVREP